MTRFRLALVRDGSVPTEWNKQLRQAEDVARLMAPLAADLDREHFWTVLLDGKNRVTGLNLVSIGTLTAALVHPREVFKPAIAGTAAAVILVHYVPGHIMQLLWPPPICGRERRSPEIHIASITGLAT